MTRDGLAKFGLSILNIPDELRLEMEWAVSTMEVLDPETGRRDKSPRNPKTGERLSVTDPKGWGTFEEAINAGYPAVGMRLTDKDPFTVIDLDKSNSEEQNALARKIFDAFDSYTEKSFSGDGVHIILTGPNEAGRRKGNVEVYSQERYIICTGKILKGAGRITDGGKTLENLKAKLDFSENPDTLPVVQNKDATESDTNLMRRMFEAANGARVRELYMYEPDPRSDDWSKLDASLAQHICFYTDNVEQALRIFRGSKLYRGGDSENRKSGYEKTEKYEADYLIRRTFAKAWHRKAERAAEAKLADERARLALKRRNESDLKPSNVVHAEATTVPANSDSVLPNISKPDGLLGEIAQFIYDMAPRPVWEVAIAGALAMMSGIAGRHYNINRAGLGLYTVLLADTGRGKEAASTGVSAIMSAVAEKVPAMHMFRGPAAFASGAALFKFMGQSENEANIPSKFMILSEFGHTLNVIAKPDAARNDITLRQVLLDLYSKNSWGNFVMESVYADKQNNTGIIEAPCLSLLGDTTPDMFFDSVDKQSIAEGFLPRFLIIEYDGPRVPSNYDRNSIPSADLIARLQTLVHQVITMHEGHQKIDIGYEEGAKDLLVEFDKECDNLINAKSESEKSTKELWNRAHLMALKIAGICAVGENFFDPKVTVKAAEWAISLVRRSIQTMELRIDDGQFGADEDGLADMIRPHIYDFFDRELAVERGKLKGQPNVYIDNALLPTSYLYAKVGRKSIFAKNSKGPTQTIRSTMESLIAQGDIVEIDAKPLLPEELKRARVQRCYSKGPNYDTNRLTYEMNHNIKGG